MSAPSAPNPNANAPSANAPSANPSANAPNPNAPNANAEAARRLRSGEPNIETRAREMRYRSEVMYVTRLIEEAQKECGAHDWIADWDNERKMIFFSKSGKRVYDCPIPKEGRWFKKISHTGKPYWVRVDVPKGVVLTSWYEPAGKSRIVTEKNATMGGRRKQTRRAKRRGRKTRSRR